MDFRQPGAEIAEAVIVVDLQGRVLSWNSHAETLFGYSAAEAVGTSLKDLLLPSEHDAEPSDDEACIYEALRRRKDGGLLYVNASRSAVRRDSSGADYIVYAKRDVTHLKVARDTKLSRDSLRRATGIDTRRHTDRECDGAHCTREFPSCARIRL